MNRLSIFQSPSAIIGAISKEACISAPANIDAVSSWCDEALLRINPDGKGGVSGNGIAPTRTPGFSPQKVVRVSPVWVGGPSSRFSSNAHSQASIKTVTPGIDFHEFSGAGVFIMGGLGVVLFDSEARVFEEFSTPYWKLLNLFDFDFAVAMRNSIHIAATGCLLLDRFWEANYAHWLLDLLPRTLPAATLPSGTKFVTTGIRHSWQMAMLNSAGLDARSVIGLFPYQMVRFDRMVCASDIGRKVAHPAAQANPDVLQYIRKFLPEPTKLSGVSTAPRVLMIERRGSRLLLNADEMRQAFVNRGFAVDLLDCAELSLEVQWRAFASADVVIAVHGAALANVVFMQPGKVLVELHPRDFGNPAFYMLAAQVGAKYIGVTELNSSPMTRLPQYRNVQISSETISRVIDKVWQELR